MQIDLDDDDAAFGALAATISAIGSADFEDALFLFLSRMLGIDEIFAFERAPASKPATLLTRNRSEDAPSRASLYCDRLHAQDPIASILAREPDKIRGVRVRPGELSDQFYRDFFFGRPGLVDKIGLCLPAERSWIVLNLYRQEASGSFANADFQTLRWVGPFSVRAVAQHHAARFGTERPQDQLLCKAERLLAARKAGLTRRELDVCARTSIGMTAEAIALDLGLAASSVLTYRKRAYLRLNISSPYQLMALLLH